VTQEDFSVGWLCTSVSGDGPQSDIAACWLGDGRPQRDIAVWWLGTVRSTWNIVIWLRQWLRKPCPVFGSNAVQLQ
jgi:hypothetical protein